MSEEDTDSGRRLVVKCSDIMLKPRPTDEECREFLAEIIGVDTDSIEPLWALAAVHKARVNIKDTPDLLKKISKHWLKENGFSEAIQKIGGWVQ